MINRTIIITVIVLTASFSTCDYFDPMFGLIYPTYGSSTTLSYTGGSPATIVPDAQFSYSTVTVDGTNVYLSYCSEGCLYFARSKDFGYTWERTQLTSNNTSLVSMVTKGGVTAIACSAENAIMSFRTGDGGTSFTKTTVENSGSPTGDCYTGVACYGNLVFISYAKEDSEGNSDMRVAVSRNRGQTFAIRAIDDGAVDAQMATSIAYDPASDVVYACYQRATGVSAENLSVVSLAGPDYSEVIGPYVVTGSESGNTWCNSMVVNESGRVILAYRGSSGPIIKHTTDIASWSSATANTVWNTDVYLTTVPGYCYAVYYNSSLTPGAVKYATSTNGGANWTTGTVTDNASRGGANGRKCSIAVAPDRNTMFVSFVSYTADPDTNPPSLLLSKWTSTNGWNMD